MLFRSFLLFSFFARKTENTLYYYMLIINVLIAGFGTLYVGYYGGYVYGYGYGYLVALHWHRH